MSDPGTQRLTNKKSGAAEPFISRSLVKLFLKGKLMYEEACALHVHEGMKDYCKHVNRICLNKRKVTLAELMHTIACKTEGRHEALASSSFYGAS